MDKIEGQPVDNDASAITLLVYRTETVRGEVSTWTGERVSIPHEGIMGYQPRKLSKVKTFALVGGVVAAVILTAIGIKWDFGADGSKDGDDPPLGESMVGTLPIHRSR
jgi:hypothetical protein